MFKRLKTSCFLLVLLISTAVGAAGQSREKPAKPKAETKLPGLERSDRAESHNDIPIRLIGIEQGENSFREQAPALKHSDRRSAQVDITQSYQRKLAMYEEGKIFSLPLGLVESVSSMVMSKPPVRANANDAASTSKESPVSGDFITWMLPLVLLLLLAGLFLQNRGVFAKNRGVFAKKAVR